MTPLADNLVGASALGKPEPVFPLEVVFCETCGLVQIKETVPPEQLFCQDYPYYSSFADMVVDNAKANALDLIEQADFIAQDNVDAAERFLTATENAFQFLAENPSAGRLREFSNARLSGIRMWPIRGFDKHLIFYRDLSDAVEIIRVLHAARDIDRILGDRSDLS